MPPKRFFLSLGLAGTIALALYGCDLCILRTCIDSIWGITFAILVKTTYKRKLTILCIGFFVLNTFCWRRGWLVLLRLSSTKLGSCS